MSTPLPIIVPTTRKGMIIMMAVLFVVCIAITVFAYSEWSADQQVLKSNGQPDFSTLSESGLKDGLIVKGNIDAALSTYAEDYKETLGVRTSEESKQMYYLVPIYEADENGYITFKYLITYVADPEDYKTMDEISENFWNNQAGAKALTVDNARIVALPADNKKYISEWVNSKELWGEGNTFYDWCAATMIFGTDDKAVIESKIVPFMIDKTPAAGTDPVIMWMFLGFSGLCLLILVILLLRKKPISGMINNTGDPDIMRPVQ